MKVKEMSKKHNRNVNEMAEEEKNPVEAEELPEEELLPEGDQEQEAPKEEQFEPMSLTAEEVKALKEKLDKLQEERDDAVKQAQRLQAEFENYRKRNATLVSDSRDDGIRDAVKNMLPVLDNFERALENAPEDPFAQGIRNIAKQFSAALEKCGAEEIEADGKFDPNLHDAVMKDNVEGVESGAITAVLQKGWRVKGKIVRYTMVKVNE